VEVDGRKVLTLHAKFANFVIPKKDRSQLENRRLSGQKVATAKRPKGGKRRTPKPKTTVSKKAPVKRRKSKRGVVVGAQPRPPAFAIQELDPRSKCGPGTSVQRLLRVREKGESGDHNHLVFLDRHGWYCEHGRNCAAVPHAMKFGSRARK
jgi:hypothetical protein